MDAIVLARLVEVVGRGDGERKKGREFYAPTVTPLRLLLCWNQMRVLLILLIR